jgi:hypothetical protein
MAKEITSVVEITWNVNPFRGDAFEEAWRAAAEAALDYGAGGWAFFRSKDDPLVFKQYAAFEEKLDFERYWYSEEISQARAEAAGLFQVPLLPVWLKVVGAGVLSEAEPPSPESKETPVT